jgi:soluble lytic murein transglycosylase
MRNCLAKITRDRWYSAALAIALALACAGLAAGQRAKTPAKAAPRKNAAKAPSKTAAKTPARKKVGPVRPVGPVAEPSLPRFDEPELAALVRGYREAPTAARRSTIQAYAAAHAKDSAGALARFALGVAAYQNNEFETAAAELAMVEGKLPRLADYAGYYLAAARVESKAFAAVSKPLQATRNADPASPFEDRSWLVEARALQVDKPAEAVRLLRGHYAALPQPEGDLIIADSYLANRQQGLAAEFYQRVYYGFISGDASARAAAALPALEQELGAACPQPLPQQRLRRAELLFQGRQYTRARAEYEGLARILLAGQREHALVRAGAARLLEGKSSAAALYLRNLELSDDDAAAERLYYLAEAGRRLGDDSAMLSAVKRLEEFRDSPWRLKALLTAANRFLLVNKVEKFLPLYQAIADDFPNDPSAGLASWKVTFQAYLRNGPDAGERLRDHLRRFPAHPTTGAALYFLGRAAERENDSSSARACYQRLARAFQNHYYAMLARQRLTLPGMSAAVTGATARFVDDLKLASGKPLPSEPGRDTTVRIERSRLLRGAGLYDLADSELRFGARKGGQSSLLALEMAAEAESPFRAMRALKSLSPEYLSLSVDQAPRGYWEYLFPLPYRLDLESSARRQAVDVYLLAGLIRQESEFNPQAISSAKAYGLMQVRPGTGRDFARGAGVSHFSASTLFQPSVNVKIGSAILKSMLERQGGRIEQTLAAYNAGPLRVAEWQTWGDWREPAEFVESIPFTETRDYVQAVLRNADLYRRLYAR